MGLARQHPAGAAGESLPPEALPPELLAVIEALARAHVDEDYAAALAAQES